jgi:hypothetical protein
VTFGFALLHSIRAGAYSLQVRTNDLASLPACAVKCVISSPIIDCKARVPYELVFDKTCYDKCSEEDKYVLVALWGYGWEISVTDELLRMHREIVRNW